MLITNDDDNKNLSFKEIFEELVKKKLTGITKLNNETNFNDFIHNGKNMSKKTFDGFENRIKLFEKIKFSDIKLEKWKNIKMYLNQI